jgi:hypothetical protein
MGVDGSQARLRAKFAGLEIGERRLRVPFLPTAYTARDG